MSRALTLAAGLVLAAGPGVAQTGGVPSGQPLVLWEVVWERVEGSGAQAVLRFIAPEIARDGGRIGPDAALQDVDWLCETHAVPLSTLPAARADAVVVTLMDRPVPRGRTDPEVTQYFETFTIVDGACVVEEF